MVAIKAGQAASFLKAPDARLQAFLFFGSDAGLVSERAQRLAKLLAERENPPGEVLRLDEMDIDADPDRLVVELQTMPMFSGRKVIRVSTSRRVNTAALKPLLTGEPLAGLLIVEAANLKADDSLRGLFEKSDRAAAVACYADEARDLDAVVDEVLKAARLTIDPDARQLLVCRLGADRAMSRGEVEKLALYAHGKSEITVDDVDLVVGDASEQVLDKIVNAAAVGESGRAVIECDRAVSAGESPQTIILAIQRHFLRLHRVRAQLDQGRSLDDVMRTMRPPLHFKQKDQFGAQLRLWSADRLSRALTGIAAAAKAARLTSALEQPLAERLLLDLSRLAKVSATAARR